jgi:hypothetical protein
MQCDICGEAFRGSRCSCGWQPRTTGASVVGGKKVFAPWRHFTCACCDYDFAFRSFQETTKTVCSRCQRKASVMCRHCQAVEVES